MVAAETVREKGVCLCKQETHVEDSSSTIVTKQASSRCQKLQASKLSLLSLARLLIPNSVRGLGRNLTIEGAVTFEYEHEVRSYMELSTDRSCFRRLFLACSIQASVQMTGVSAI